MSTMHYDVIIIGSGAGGGTLAHRLAPTGERVLILERGDYVRREKDNWDSHAVNVAAKYHTKESWSRRGWPATASAHELLRGRQHEILWRGALPAAPRGLRRAAASRRRVAGVADRLRRSRAVLHARRNICTTCTAHEVRTRRNRLRADRTRIPRSVTSRAFNSSVTTSHAPGCARFTCRSESCSTSSTPPPAPASGATRATGSRACVHAKSDAQVVCVDPALAHPNVTLLTNAFVERLETTPSGREISRVVVKRNGGTETLLRECRRDVLWRDQLGGAAASIGF